MIEALHGRRDQVTLLAVLAASGVAWLPLAGLPTAQTWVCGVDGLAPVAGAWSVSRVVELTGMWQVMAFAMMLPAAALMAMLLSPRPVFAFMVGYLGFLVPLSIVAALGHWMLESAGMLGEGSRMVNPLVSGFVVVGIGAYHVWQSRRNGNAVCGSSFQHADTGLSHGWRHGCSSLGCCLTMVGLQFVGGVMNIGLMAALTVWMLMETLLPWKRHLAASTGIALLTAGSLTIVAAVV